jgi:hypothetical protein
MGLKQTDNVRRLCQVMKSPKWKIWQGWIV